MYTAVGETQTTFDVELMCNDVYPWLDAPTMVHQNWAKVGIKAKLKPGEEEALYANVLDVCWDVFLTRFNGGLILYDPRRLTSRFTDKSLKPS